MNFGGMGCATDWILDADPEYDVDAGIFLKGIFAIADRAGAWILLMTWEVVDEFLWKFSSGGMSH